MAVQVWSADSRCLIIRCANHRLQPASPWYCASCKIGEHHPVVGNFGGVCEKNVFRLEIAMNYALAVKIAQPSEHLPNNDSAIKFLDPIVPVDKRHQVSSCRQLCK